MKPFVIIGNNVYRIATDELRLNKGTKIGSYEDVGWTDSLSAKKETRRIEDLAGFVSDIIEFENPHPLTKAEYRRLDPLILDDRGDLLDGYHRLAGLVVGGETGNIPVIVVYDEDLASDLSEPGYLQDKALEALKEIL